MASELFNIIMNGFKEIAEHKGNLELAKEIEANRLSLGESINEKLVKKGSKWQVQSEKGKNMGTYDTEKEAKERLKQVEYFKHKNESIDDDFKLHYLLKEDIPTFWEWVDDQGLDPDVVEENPDLEEYYRQQYDITFNRNLKGKNYHVSVKYTNGKTKNVDMGYFYEDAEDYVDELSKDPNVESIHLVLNKTGKLQNVYNKDIGWKKPLHSFILDTDIEESLEEDANTNDVIICEYDEELGAYIVPKWLYDEWEY